MSVISEHVMTNTSKVQGKFLVFSIIINDMKSVTPNVNKAIILVMILASVQNTVSMILIYLLMRISVCHHVAEMLVTA